MLGIERPFQAILRKRSPEFQPRIYGLSEF